MKKFHDCSRSSEAPKHNKENMGPPINDIVLGLRSYCHRFNWGHTNDPEEADLIFTNDVYPSSVLEINRPRVKRMDGVYWHKDLVKKNKHLNKAAIQSDSVIFISNYSMHSYYELYGDKLKYSKVILNCVDDTLFYPINIQKEENSLVASASNWSRPEKRFSDLMEFMSNFATDYKLNLIGKCDFITPKNVVKHGYIEDSAVVNRIMNMSEAMVNFSYRDPAPKTVCQAINCRLPLIYAFSGGTPELVKNGIPILDQTKIQFESFTPNLKESCMSRSWKEFKDKKNALISDSKYVKNNFMSMLHSYFSEFERVIY